MLKSNGIDEENFILQQHSFNLEDLVSGKTDAMASYVSNEPLRLDKRGIEYKIFDPKDFGFTFYDDILFTSNKLLKTNPNLVKNFYEATVKGWQYAFSHIGITAEVIFNKYNTQNKTLVDLVSEGEALKNLAFHKNTHDVGCLDEDVLNEIVNTFKVLGLIKNEVNIDDFIYSRNRHEAIDIELDYNEVYLMLLLFMFFILLTIGVFFYVAIKTKLLRINQALHKKIKEKTKQLNEQNEVILSQSRIAAIGEMLGNIAHQWRQPLSIITIQSSNVQASVELEQKISDENLVDTMKSIGEQCQYLSNTIDDFRSFFKQDTTQLSEIEISQTIAKIENLVKPSLDNNNIKLTIDIKEDIIIHTNESAIIQILLNIINNSKDAILQNDIEEDFRLISIEVYNDEKKVYIKVIDSGKGIKDEVKDKIFEPYVTTKHQSIGTGIGLYMTYNVLKNTLNGDILAKNISFTYKDKDLKGAEFIISIPLK